jgi:hypothetical protein
MARRTTLALACVAALLASLPSAAAARDSSFRLIVDGKQGGHLDVQLPAGWLTGLLASSSFECRADGDAEARELARSLDRQGEGGVFTWTDEHGRDAVARRSRGQLKIDVEDDQGKHSVLEMPWPLAECLLLGRQPEEGLARALGRGGVHVKIEGDDGGLVRIFVDGRGSADRDPAK